MRGNSLPEALRTSPHLPAPRWDKRRRQVSQAWCSVCSVAVNSLLCVTGKDAEAQKLLINTWLSRSRHSQ